MIENWTERDWMAWELFKTHYVSEDAGPAMAYNQADTFLAERERQWANILRGRVGPEGQAGTTEKV